jgi:flagellar motor switch protein FliG
MMGVAAKRQKGYEKAAILLMAIGEEAASEVMKNLDAKDIHKIAKAMAALEDLSSEDIDAVVHEFHEHAGGGAIYMGGDYMKKVLTKTLGNDKAKSILEKVSSGDNESMLETLKWLDAKTIANFIKGEHPQTMSVILAHLEQEHAAAVISFLPEKLRTDVVLRVATLESVQPEVIRELDAAVQWAFSTRAGHSSVAGGVGAVAAILNNLDSTTEGAIMGEIEGMNPDLAAQIQKLMFVFSDLVTIDDRGIQMILKEVGNEDLVMALKTADEALKDKILKNMSERAAQMLREDMEATGPVKLSDIEKAQQTILKIARRLEQEGKIVIGGKGGEELVF